MTYLRVVATSEDQFAALHATPIDLAREETYSLSDPPKREGDEEESLDDLVEELAKIDMIRNRDVDGGTRVVSNRCLNI
jgi:hypothetical protein